MWRRRHLARACVSEAAGSSRPRRQLTDTLGLGDGSCGILAPRTQANMLRATVTRIAAVGPLNLWSERLYVLNLELLTLGTTRAQG